MCVDFLAFIFLYFTVRLIYPKKKKKKKRSLILFYNENGSHNDKIKTKLQ